MIYKYIIQSVLTYCITCWYVGTSVSDMKLNKIVKCAKKLDCNNVDDLDDMYGKAT